MTRTNPTQANAAARREWVLVVDDDEPIRQLITSAFDTEALEIVAAPHAQAALLVLEQRSTEPLLVVTDVLMPGMDGLTLARKLTTRLKRSKIAVMSGHLSDASWWPVDLREVAFLTKPFRMAELDELIVAARSESRGAH